MCGVVYVGVYVGAGVNVCGVWGIIVGELAVDGRKKQQVKPHSTHSLPIELLPCLAIITFPHRTPSR